MNKYVFLNMNLFNYGSFIFKIMHLKMIHYGCWILIMGQCYRVENHTVNSSKQNKPRLRASFILLKTKPLCQYPPFRGEGKFDTWTESKTYRYTLINIEIQPIQILIQSKDQVTPVKIYLIRIILNIVRQDSVGDYSTPMKTMIRK